MVLLGFPKSARQRVAGNTCTDIFFALEHRNGVAVAWQGAPARNSRETKNYEKRVWIAIVVTHVLTVHDAMGTTNWHDNIAGNSRETKKNEKRTRAAIVFTYSLIVPDVRTHTIG